jgi:hypothetical protein
MKEKRSNQRAIQLSAAVLVSLLAASAAVRAEPRIARPEVLDDRYHHGHFYPPHGAVVHELPPGYHPYWHHGSQLYFAGGVWYAPGPHGFIVTRPPAGLIIRVLPPFYTTVWIGGVPYYYANEVYYRWDPEASGYEVVDPPAGADHPGTAPQVATEDFFIYPKNGQTSEQQSADRYECYNWSRNQTGFDPTQSGGGVPPDQLSAKRQEYRRALTACLEARGYSVK